jgi:hypothetical protein
VVAHAFNPSTQEAEAGRWIYEFEASLPQQPGLPGFKKNIYIYIYIYVVYICELVLSSHHARVTWLKKKYIYIYIYIYNYVAYICESVLSSHHVGHRGQSGVIRWEVLLPAGLLLNLLTAAI